MDCAAGFCAIRTVKVAKAGAMPFLGNFHSPSLGAGGGNGFATRFKQFGANNPERDPLGIGQVRGIASGRFCGLG